MLQQFTTWQNRITKTAILYSMLAITLPTAFGLSIALHSFLLIIGFQAVLPPQQPPSNSMDVIIVAPSVVLSATNDNPDYLANLTQDGGAENKTEHSLDRGVSTPAQSPIPSSGVVPTTSVQARASAAKQQRAHLITAAVSENLVDLVNQRPKTTEPDQGDALLNTYDSTIAELREEISNQWQRYSTRPRKKFITASTRDAIEAQYMHHWIKRVEQVGNRNSKKLIADPTLSGSLLLVVGINQDGTVHETILRQSSGNALLDKAAQRIVQLAAPYRAFDAKLKKSTDILYITRTWQFSANNKLSTHE